MLEGLVTVATQNVKTPRLVVIYRQPKQREFF